MKYELPEHGTAEKSVFQALELSAWYLLLAVSAWVHALAGRTLPLPWDGEVSFLWPAINLATHYTILAPELIPDRPVLWMPTGFMVVCGAVFKLTGLALAIARWLCWVILVGAFVALAFWLRSFPLRLVSLGILSLFYLNGAFATAGIIASMDGLFLLQAVGGFPLLPRGRPLPGLSAGSCYWYPAAVRQHDGRRRQAVSVEEILAAPMKGSEVTACAWSCRSARRGNL